MKTWILLYQWGTMMKAVFLCHRVSRTVSTALSTALSIAVNASTARTINAATISHTLKAVVTTLLMSSALVTGSGHASDSESLAPSAAITQFLKAPRLAGEGQMRFLGFRIYEARLWVSDQFDAKQYQDYPLALELIYQRAFSAQDIAQRSVQEIERQQTLTTEQIEQWTQQLAQWLPDVKAGERLTGLYEPGQGMRLWLGDQRLGSIDNPQLARLFFGIWLSPQTSEPSLRTALLSKLAHAAP